jgi:uridine phosphorylase
MRSEDYPILEYDGSSDPVISYDYGITPEQRTAPEHAVLCFFGEVISAVVEEQKAEVIYTMRWEDGPRPLYRIMVDGQPLVIAQAPVGAPMAAVQVERLVALGVRKFIACGGAGTLIPDTTVGHAVVPTAAIRDEGTSYHYLPPSREALPSAKGVVAIEGVLQNHSVPYTLGKTWTTDGVFRETRAKADRRREEGCLTVEMEAAAFFAVAQHRGVDFAQILYCGDDLSGTEWDDRGWSSRTSTREKLFWLAVEACLEM